MDSRKFFAAVRQMRQQQRQYQEQLEMLKPLQAQLDLEKIVDDEIKRVEGIYEVTGMQPFWNDDEYRF